MIKLYPQDLLGSEENCLLLNQGSWEREYSNVNEYNPLNKTIPEVTI